MVMAKKATTVRKGEYGNIKTTTSINKKGTVKSKETMVSGTFKGSSLKTKRTASGDYKSKSVEKSNGKTYGVDRTKTKKGVTKTRGY
jgi:hypothetical protein